MDFDLDYDIKALDKKQQQNTDIEQIMKIDQTGPGAGGQRTHRFKRRAPYLQCLDRRPISCSLPNSSHRGVSRKIEDRTARERLKKLIRSFEMPQGHGADLPYGQRPRDTGNA